MATKKQRKSCVDIWDSYMVKDATWTENDIPFCPTTAKSLPKKLISYSEAKTLCNTARKNGRDNYHFEGFIQFYQDDQKFDGTREGIWAHPKKALDIIRHFDGMITPDFSTYADFPEPYKIIATYKMRAFGFYAGKNGINVINNVRWGTSETWKYCCDGIEKHSTIAIGTVASNPRIIDNRPLFEEGLRHVAKVLKPATIIVYGSANNQVFKELIAQGINIVAFSSQTSLAHKRER